MSFSDEMNDLQEIIVRLDSGQISLEESIELFERGVTLVNSCRKFLEEAHQRVKLLSSDENDLEGSDWDPLSEGKDDQDE
jgi:exodeoxyribonuclease VII small subunit